MNALGVGIRMLSTGAGLLLVGVLAMSLLAGPSDKATARLWQRRLGRSTRWLAALVLLAGVAALGWQVTVATGRADASTDVAAWLRFQRTSRMPRSRRYAKVTATWVKVTSRPAFRSYSTSESMVKPFSQSSSAAWAICSNANRGQRWR